MQKIKKEHEENKWLVVGVSSNIWVMAKRNKYSTKYSTVGKVREDLRAICRDGSRRSLCEYKLGAGGCFHSSAADKFKGLRPLTSSFQLRHLELFW